MEVLIVHDDCLEYCKSIIKAYFMQGKGLGIDLTNCTKESKLEIGKFLETLVR